MEPTEGWDAGDSRAIMLGIRHRCGQEIQFWIPAELVGTIAQHLDEQVETMGLADWMRDQGILREVDEPPTEVLVDRLRSELAPRGVAFIHVDRDVSTCPLCGTMLRWLDILVEVAKSSRGEAGPGAPGPAGPSPN